MRNSQPLTITLPLEMAQMVKDKVASGESPPKARSSVMACARLRRVMRRLNLGCARKSCR